MYECTVYQTTAKKPFGESKLRFKADPDAENKVLNLYPAVTYQKVLGFGSAFTDASALNYAAMSPENRERFIRLYFDKKDGLGLNFCRTHINSCDFAGKKYTYVQNGDKELATFSIAHDEENIIPMIRAALKANDELRLFCSPWSPPAFMKTNGNMLLGGKLRPEYRQAWANYFVKYIRAYEKQGIPFFALTVQNEPMALQTWESCKFTAEETCLFVRDYLYPALKAAGLDTKIMIWDHNKEHVVDWAQAMHQVDGAAEHIWGTAFHWYSGDHFDALRIAHEINPDKPLIESEYCVDYTADPEKDYEDGLKYAHEIIGNFNNYMAATVDWNMLLDMKGGPYHARLGGCGAMAHYDKKAGKLIITNKYYAMAHFSKFIRRGAVRIGTTSFNRDVCITAFQNPGGEIVAVIQNSGRELTCRLRLNNCSADIKLPERSVTTAVIEGEN